MLLRATTQILIVCIVFMWASTASTQHDPSIELECQLTGRRCDLASALQMSSQRIDRLIQRVRREPNSMAAYTALIQSYMDSGEWNKAGEVLNTFEELSRETRNAGTDTTLMWIERQHLMIAMLKGTVSLSVTHSFGHAFNDLARYNMGMHALKKRKIATALPLLRSVVNNVRDWPPALHAYGVVLYHSDKFEKAAEIFQACNRSCYDGVTLTSAQLAQSSVRNLQLIAARAESLEFARRHHIIEQVGTRIRILELAVQESLQELDKVEQKIEIIPMFIELGVWKGDTLRIIANAAAPHSVHGFDSFLGLPESFDSFPQGAFSTNGRVPVRPSWNMEIHSGWFNQSLPIFFVQPPVPPTTSSSAKHAAVLFVHVDCDLYSSALEALDVIAPFLIVGSVLHFDQYFGYHNWQNGEAKAWDVIAKKHAIKFVFQRFWKRTMTIMVQNV